LEACSLVFLALFCCPASQEQQAFKASDSTFPPLQCKSQGESPASQSSFLAFTSLSFVGYSLMDRNFQFCHMDWLNFLILPCHCSVATYSIGRAPPPLPCTLSDTKLTANIHSIGKPHFHCSVPSAPLSIDGELLPCTIFPPLAGLQH